MRINKPLNQVRLTNVAIVRLKSHGFRFEIACYKNKILNWRSGIEKDLDEVLQINAIFHNVSKGEYAKKESLLKAFETDDIETISKIILKKGQLQVSEKEREALVEQIFKDICNLIYLYTVNPVTGFPLTISMIESTIKTLGYSVQLDQSPKQQALKLIDIMQNTLPNQISRAPMRLRVSCTIDQKEKLLNFLSAECFSTFEQNFTDEGNNINEIITNSYIHDTTNQALLQQFNNNEKKEKNSNFSVIILCSPKYYRSIDEFVIYNLKPAGSLQLIASNVRKGNINSDNSLLEDTQNNSNFIKESISTQNDYEENIDLECNMYKNSQNDKFTELHINKEQVDQIPKTSSRCSICLENFSNTKVYRSHCKTDRHVLNLQRKLENLQPFNESEYFYFRDNSLIK